MKCWFASLCIQLLFEIKNKNGNSLMFRIRYSYQHHHVSLFLKHHLSRSWTLLLWNMELKLVMSHFCYLFFVHFEFNELHTHCHLYACKCVFERGWLLFCFNIGLNLNHFNIRVHPWTSIMLEKLVTTIFVLNWSA